MKVLYGLAAVTIILSGSIFGLNQFKEYTDRAFLDSVSMSEKAQQDDLVAWVNERNAAAKTNYLVKSSD